MGVTAHDVDLLERTLQLKPLIKSVTELGSQNLYVNGEQDPPFASEWYKARGLKYACIDLGGDNGAWRFDLSEDIVEKLKSQNTTIDQNADLITDFGTSEHVVQMEKFTSVPFHNGYINSIYPDGVKDVKLGFYNCWLNKHKLLNAGGAMVNVNPKTGHWPGHGYSYYTQDFYKELCKIAGYKILLLEEHAAMGNTTDGVNVVCILEKVSEKFPTFDEFCKLDFRTS
jgi:hypothetical protein